MGQRVKRKQMRGTCSLSPRPRIDNEAQVGVEPLHLARSFSS